MLFGKGAIFFLVAQATVTLTAGFATSSVGVAPFGLTQQRCSFVTSRVAADPVEAADEPAVEAVPEPEAAETESEAVETESEEVVAEESSQEGDDDNTEETAPAPPPKKDRLTVFVGNLSFDTTDAEVRDKFSEYGKVELVSVPRDISTGKSRGFAFVDMSTQEEIDACIENLNGIEFLGRKIRVAASLPKDQVQKRKQEIEDGSKKIYVGNIPFDTTQEELTDFFSEYGEVKEVYIPTDINTGQPRGFAFITMDEADAQNAIEQTNGIQYQGRMLAVSEPLPRGKKAPPRSYPRRTKLYVGNLSFYTTLDAVQALFEEYGTVFDCYMPSDRETGASRGFAFVTMDPEAANQAMDETDGYELDGRIIRVNEAQPKFERFSYSDEGSYDDGAADGEFEGDDDTYDDEAEDGF